MNHTNNINPFNGYGFYEEATGYDSIREQKETLKVVDNTFIVFGHGVVDKFPTPGPTPRKPEFLKFTAQQDNSTVAFVYYFNAPEGTEPPVFNIQYRLGENQEWQEYEVRNPDGGEEPMTIELNSGESVQFKGINPDGFYHDEELPDEGSIEYGMYCSMTGTIAASGDITSILNGVGGDCPLTDYCYYNMFDSCTSLTTAPELPATTLADYCYIEMFDGCTSLTTAPELPANTLAEGCYSNMFYGCTALTTAPELPATTLADYCYIEMFGGCTSLTTAPELPATMLARSCYESMFGGCTSLTTAPDLPATTLADGCYGGMFDSCTSLNSVTCLATDISATDCTSNWLSNVAQTGTFYKAASMSDWTEGDSGIPENWTVEDYIGGIKLSQKNRVATIKIDRIDNGTGYYTINNGAHVSVGNGITTIDVTEAMDGQTLLVHGVFSGNVKEESMTLWYNNPYAVPFYVENITNQTETLIIYHGLNYSSGPLEIEYSLDRVTWDYMDYDTENHRLEFSLEPNDKVYLRSNTTIWGSWDDVPVGNNISGVSKIGGNIMSLVYGSRFTGNEVVFPTDDEYVFAGLFAENNELQDASELILPATTLNVACYYGMLYECQSLVNAPELPATTLVGYCYSRMFEGCTSLNSVTCLATDISASSCTSGWLYNVAQTGTFYKAASMDDWTEGDSGIPSGWTVTNQTHRRKI